MPSLAPGTALGPYVIDSPLGEGGMGEVYRARDTTLNRLVALKILPDVFATDPDRLSRFEREAQVLAQLNHPHIAQIYGFERGHRALAMELVEGDDLAARIARGALPIDESLAIATQVADALEAAHEHGIVHRDLKPANIKVRADGTVKVLDFGLAKPGASSASVIDNSPTITSPVGMTAQGMILGTAAYMAPEQARGKVVDRRADIWAFGCVVYEMLTGGRAFAGETVTDLLAAVVSREPDWTALPPGTPAPVRTLLARCLVKDARQRLRDIGDARLELTRIIDNSSPEVGMPPATPAASPIARWLPWTVAAASLVVAAATVFMTARPEPAAATPTRFVIPPPQGVGIDVPGTVRFAGVVTVSPDGQRVALLATAPGGRLWVRDLAAIQPTQLRGTENAQQPFWSPDGRSIGFFSQQRVRVVDLDTSMIRDVTSAVGAGAAFNGGGTWNGDGVIVFASPDGLRRVSASGGESVAVTTLDKTRGDRVHTWPMFLPDGRRFLFHLVTADAQTSGTYLGSLDASETRFIVATTANVAYAPPGYLLYLRGSVLVAQPFDAERAELSGAPQPLLQQVAYNSTNRHAEFSVSRTGVLAYAVGGLDDARLGWFDRGGIKLGTVEATAHMDIAPDLERVAADRVDPQTGMRDIWVFDRRRGSRTRLTDSPQNDWVPKWSPDGTRIAFTSDREMPGLAQIYVKNADGSGPDQLLLKTDWHKHHLDWSRDGQLLVFESGGTVGSAGTSQVDLWTVRLTGAAQPTPLLQGPYVEAQPSFSPDTRLIAYTSDESGALEVYVQPFPSLSARWQISTNGGIQPLWRRDGKEMYYLAADGKIMAVDVDPTVPSFGVPKALFQSGAVGDATTEHFAVTADGQRFLMQDTATAARAGFTVVLNWQADLK
jgi:Tol biopolymer transport system component